MSTELFVNVLVEFFPQVIEINVHALVRQPYLVHHDFTNFENAFYVNHSADLIFIELELMVGDLVQLDFFCKVCDRHPLKQGLLIDGFDSWVFIVFVFREVGRRLILRILF